MRRRRAWTGQGRWWRSRTVWGMAEGSARRRVARRLVAVAFAVYAVAMAYLVFGPAPGDEAEVVGGGVRAASSVLSDGGAGDGLAAGRSDGVLGLDDEQVSNVVLFVPLPVLAGLLWPRRWWLAVPGGVALSGLIELGQKTVFDHRWPQWSDVWLNSAGVVLGGAMWLLVVGGRRLFGR